jgi:broad specificity phosphatase PhoE
MEYLRLYLLRHGQTVDYAKRLFNGWRDVGLTDLGKTQLDQAAEAMKGIPLDAIYSSDLSRARYGGEALSRLTGVPLIQLPEFKEMGFGECEGLSFPEIERRYPDLASGIMSPQNGQVVFPGGESDVGFLERISKATASLASRHPQGRVALVSHAGVGRAVLAYYMGLSTSTMWAIHQDFGALHVLDVFPNGTYVIRALNAHLGPEGYKEGGPGWEAILA